jgi:phosphatidylinositol glycan class W
VLQARFDFFSPYTVPAALADFLLNAAAILLATTLYSSSPWTLNAILLSSSVLLFAASSLPSSNTRSRKTIARPPQAHNGGKQKKEKPTSTIDSLLPKKPYVTTYRGTMMMITCVAILAVDFKVFPRRFAKVESWGTSLMDLGVGSFVFSAGVVSVRPLLKAQLLQKADPFGRRFISACRHSIPLFVLGLVRLYSVKGLDYPEHVSEYGVHWNFFFTLGLLPPFVACFSSLFRLIKSYTFWSVSVAVLYQLILDFTSLKAFILVAPRTDLLSQNREGVFSFIGYLSIFLAGQSIGTIILPQDLSIASSLSWEAYFLHKLVGRVSSTSLFRLTTPANIKQQRVRQESSISSTETEKDASMHIPETISPQVFQSVLPLILTAILWITLFILSASWNYGFGLQVSRRLVSLLFSFF